MTNNTVRDVTLTVNGNNWHGWTNAEVERSIENLSGRFKVETGFDVGQLSAVPIKRQDEVAVRIGSHTVITGHVLQADPFYNRKDVGLRVSGRDRTGDMVLASAIHKGGQWLGVDVLDIAEDLCRPFDIAVSSDAELGKPFERFELTNGETCGQALARAASYRGLLVTRNNQGGLMLTRAGNKKAPAAIARGKNVIAMEPMGSDAERCSEYRVQGQDEFNFYSDPALAAGVDAKALDKHFKRYLPLIIQADNGGDQAQMQQRADHIARVRYGRAFAYKYTLEGWEANGIPWEPNTRVPVYDDLLPFDGNGQEWLIVSTHQKVDRDNADITEVVIKPIAAYSAIALPEPEDF